MMLPSSNLVVASVLFWYSNALLLSTSVKAFTTSTGVKSVGSQVHGLPIFPFGIQHYQQHYHFSSTISLHAFAEAGTGSDSTAGGGEGSSSSNSEDDHEFHRVDPAQTTTQFLSGLWQLIAQGNQMTRGVSFTYPDKNLDLYTVYANKECPSISYEFFRTLFFVCLSFLVASPKESQTVLFPNMEKEFNPRFLNLVTAHLDTCKDVCDYFGINTALVPYIKDGRVKGFTIKSFRNPNNDPDSIEKLAYDPFWDDGGDWNYEGIDEAIEAEKQGTTGGSGKEKYIEIVNKIPNDDEQIVTISKAWVDKICSDMGICPFTRGPNLAGLPIGPVFYTVDRSSSMEDMYACYWQEVVRVEQRSERDLSTTLLITPEFCMDNVELFDSFSTTLTQPLSALGVEDLIQLVFFHPSFSFRDGAQREGEGAAANYARRSPWPMINILRTNQVRAAQRGIPTGLVYKQNEKTLSKVGVDKLETMLRLRDWGEIADVKVDRKDMEALRVAREFQDTGMVNPNDQSLLMDATPAVNKVDGKLIEQGNLVNVICEALDKRLGKTSGEGVQRLTGPETSATIMASDFLLGELKRITTDGPTRRRQSSSSSSQGLSAAHQAIMDDFEDPAEGDGRDDLMGQVLFGRTGLMDGSDGGGSTERRYGNPGNNPNTFY